MIVLISQYGWRDSYEIAGAFGLVFGVFALAFIKEPARGKYAIEQKQEVKEIEVKNDE